MAEDSWLFLFAAIGAVGGIARIAQLYFQIYPFKSRTQSANLSGVDMTAPAGVFVSWKRLTFIAVVMLASAGLTIFGLVRSLRGPAYVNPKNIIATIQGGGWGIKDDPKTKQPQSVYVDFVITSVGPAAKQFRMVAVARVVYDQVDGMTDAAIDKSTAYTMVPGARRIEVPLSDISKERFKASHLVDVWLMELPIEFEPGQIVSLSSFTQLRAIQAYKVTVGGP